VRGREASSVERGAKRTCFGEGGVDGERLELLWWAGLEALMMMGLVGREVGMVGSCMACLGGTLGQ
jgi:hypothetical protein